MIREREDSFEITKKYEATTPKNERTGERGGGEGKTLP